ncbi:DUF2933 domain-containing protein [Metabacillus litoralis]|uniref:DUF2933 domain-containing protein n=1 Tax=Metabacillus TaxID=2675233 RepID=UPI001B997DFD|nr:DUF2933 domain-containing protein [Metabacillus litoralis]MCM3409866.1 DUF2933 domain-containing protein [Metabacillus litoralis]UHA58577.1 DUF2933 domain-containing protein [Metabacillus litoralis]
MEWLLYLLCPLMMLFCMKGIFTGGKKDCHSKQENIKNEQMKSLQLQVHNLQEQNMKLINEIKLSKHKNSVVSISQDTENENRFTS